MCGYGNRQSDSLPSRLLRLFSALTLHQVQVAIACPLCSGAQLLEDFKCSLCMGAITQLAVELEIFKQLDRKSTRLNSSHVAISYAVFCLKKKRRTGMWIAPPLTVIYHLYPVSA